jgi:four helix bundle protein
VDRSTIAENATIGLTLPDLFRRAASSIGANLEEGRAPSSRKDMRQKHRIALREAREANFWARLVSTDPAWRGKMSGVVGETAEFVAMLTASVRRLGQPAAAAVCSHCGRPLTSGAADE